jgi:HupE / UreJ protein
LGIPNHLPVALLTFNLGVEFGQLQVVAMAFAVWRLFARHPVFVASRTPTLYAIGSVAAYWSIGRVLAILS